MVPPIVYKPTSARTQHGPTAPSIRTQRARCVAAKWAWASVILEDERAAVFYRGDGDRLLERLEFFDSAWSNFSKLALRRIAVGRKHRCAEEPYDRTVGSLRSCVATAPSSNRFILPSRFHVQDDESFRRDTFLVGRSLAWQCVISEQALENRPRSLSFRPGQPLRDQF